MAQSKKGAKVSAVERFQQGPGEPRAAITHLTFGPRRAPYRAAAGAPRSIAVCLKARNARRRAEAGRWGLT